MVANLVPGLTIQTSDPVNFSHLTAMADYAFRLKEQLVYVNEHSFNNFQIRAGSNPETNINYIMGGAVAEWSKALL